MRAAAGARLYGPSRICPRALPRQPARGRIRPEDVLSVLLADLADAPTS